MSSKIARGWVLALMAVASSMAALDMVVASRCSLGAGGYPFARAFN